MVPSKIYCIFVRPFLIPVKDKHIASAVYDVEKIRLELSYRFF